MVFAAFLLAVVLGGVIAARRIWRYLPDLDLLPLQDGFNKNGG